MTTRDSRLPFTMLLPDSRNDPIEIHDHMTSLRMSVIEKGTVRSLDETTWNVPGAYVLLDAPDGDGTYGVYVGKAPSGVKSRLLDHERKRQWARALLIQRENYTKLSSAQAGWLEGDLYDLFDAARFARLHNDVIPGDDTVPSYEMRIFESFRDPITRVLRLLGYDTSTDEEVTVDAERSPRSRTSHDVKVEDLIEEGLLSVGDQLISTNGSWPATATVLDSRMIGYDGGEYWSPSGAASAVKGGRSVNGWDFWAVERDGRSERLSAIRKKYQDRMANGAAPATPPAPAEEGDVEGDDMDYEDFPIFDPTRPVA